MGRPDIGQWVSGKSEGGIPTVDGDRVRIGRGVGVAISRPPPARLAEEDGRTPFGPESACSTSPPDQGGYREGGSSPETCVLGLFRLDDDIIIGIVGEYYYEGESTTVFEIAATRPHRLQRWAAAKSRRTL